MFRSLLDPGSVDMDGRVIELFRKTLVFLTVGVGMSLVSLGGIFTASALHGVQNDRYGSLGVQMLLGGIIVWALAPVVTVGWQRKALLSSVGLTLVSLSWTAFLFLLFSALSGKLLNTSTLVALLPIALFAVFLVWRRRIRSNV